MQLTIQQKNKIISNFQKLKLSYDYNIHKKVCGIPRTFIRESYDLYYLIPKGAKYYVWFTSIEDKKVCLFINSYLPKKNVFVYPCNFDKKLSLNTVLYGTLHYLNTDQSSNKIFSIEEMLMYKGYDLRTQTEQYRMSAAVSFLSKDIPDNTEEKSKIKLSTCHISLSSEDLLQSYEEGKFSYIAYSIQKRNTKQGFTFNRKSDTTLISNDQSDQKRSLPYSNSNSNIMEVHADIKCDVYHLYKGSDYIGVADIPDYKTSVMMNKLFRNIKENDNLDALEESDDEEEFQDISEYKFMKKEVIYKMECKYNHKTKRFIPLRST